MPPAKRKAEGIAAAAPMRVTRAAAKRAGDAAVSSNPPPVPVVKKAEKKAKVAAAAKKQKRNEKENEDVPVESENKADEKEEGRDASEKNVLDASNKTIVVEHCKQCNSFKTRANLVKQGLEKANIGITVILNPEKPRKGCFEIRQEGGGKKFITLLDLKRPFKPMKDLHMDKVISDIIDEISKAI